MTPNVNFQSSWFEAAVEFDGAHQDGGGREDWSLEDLRDPLHFGRFVDELVTAALPENPRKPGYVTCTYLWIVEADVVLGFRATIEKNGGVYEDSRKGKRRYWINQRQNIGILGQNR
ncbi:hypothetical protein AS189_11850 [Arthrobacter alpinus]|uniref:Uncharacterized protein n=1 Tax=Arthrobacter alpinus TaxID=656366 RepID=A0A0S2LZX0_9MICC|nr:hypothetical protein [Arthrobacter alpinus]ALO67061.1 hypothetical protein AS189_11850 [Arthrobacter alpinus]